MKKTIKRKKKNNVPYLVRFFQLLALPLIKLTELKSKIKFYFYPLEICEFGIHCRYKSLEISMIWYNLIITWEEE